MSRNGSRSEPDLIELRERIETWRRHRPSRAMPGELWEAAAALAREQGVSAVARALRLGYRPLQERASRGRNGAPSSSPAKFVEMSTAAWPGSDPATTGPTIELRGADGSSLVVRLPGDSSSKLVELASTLWRGR